MTYHGDVHDPTPTGHMTYNDDDRDLVLTRYSRLDAAVSYTLVLPTRTRCVTTDIQAEVVGEKYNPAATRHPAQGEATKVDCVENSPYSIHRL